MRVYSISFPALGSPHMYALVSGSLTEPCVLKVLPCCFTPAPLLFVAVWYSCLWTKCAVYIGRHPLFPPFVCCDSLLWVLLVSPRVSGNAFVESNSRPALCHCESKKLAGCSPGPSGFSSPHQPQPLPLLAFESHFCISLLR